MLRQDMRALTDHVVWTRDYIVAAVADQPDATAPPAPIRTRKTSAPQSRATARRRGSSSRRSSRAHHGRRGRDQGGEVGRQGRAAEVGYGLAGQCDAHCRLPEQANPNWPKPTLEEMKMHLSTTTARSSRDQQELGEDARSFDAVYDHIMKMSDANRRHRQAVPGQVRDYIARAGTAL
jgi:hypothetical protein